MQSLIDGYRRFRAETWPTERARYEALALKGQKPETLIIACSDSRVDPQTVFGASPGELFVIRNVAALVPPYRPDAQYHGTSAAIEFAVRVLRVRQIVVLGHAQCGGVQAMVEGAPPEASDFVENWVQIGRPVLLSSPVPDTGAGRLSHYEAEVVRLSLTNLRSFPWIRQAEDDGGLKLHGFRFSVYTGQLEQLTDTSFIVVE